MINDSYSFKSIKGNGLQVCVISGVLDSWTLKIGPIGYPETSVRNYHYSLRNNPEERSPLLWSLRNLNYYLCFFFWMVWEKSLNVYHDNQLADGN